MNLKKAKKLSSKIYRLIDEMDHSDEFSSIEKALVKKYLVNLYDIIDHQEEEQAAPIVKKSIPAAIKTPIQKEIVVAKPKEVVEEIAIEIVKPIPADKKEPVVEKTVEIKADPIPKTEAKPTQSNTAFLDDILTTFESKDLSQKLSLKPISDIFKAMSINERIFTLNELFDGKNDEFKKCISMLNEASSMDGAKQILMDNAVDKYNWEESKKAKKVVKFLQLVHRKFI